MAFENQQLEFFARCASGFENVLAGELKELGAKRVRPLKGGVAFFGSKEDAYRACLWSRVATRVQLVIARVGAGSAEALYDAVVAYAWEDVVASGATIAVRAHGTNAKLRNTQFTALKVKDAVCDCLRNARGARPNVNASDPDLEIDLSLHRDRATLYANLSGPALHRRGYRADGVQAEAPLKETLAAGIVLAAGWDDICKRFVGRAAGATDASNALATIPSRAISTCFVDPLCGSGTLVIEAALIAADIAPGILRTKWGFLGWAQHDQDIWSRLVAEAQRRKRVGLAAARKTMRLRAGDADVHVVEIARDNLRRAGVADLVDLQVCDAAQLLEAESSGMFSLASVGLLASNPPYGQRLLRGDDLADTYAALRVAVEHVPAAWTLAAITPDETLDMALHDAPSQVLACYNGPIGVTLRIYGERAQRSELVVVSLGGVERTITVLDSRSDQFAARLRKVAKEQGKWARKEGISCYRIYDADLPDYSCSIDIYEGIAAGHGRQSANAAPQQFIRVAEYQAPSSVDPALADRRFADTLSVLSAVLDVSEDHIAFKVRKRAKGGSQYREARASSRIIHVHEGGFGFEVDLTGHLDTGLFLDHRITREMVKSRAADTRFLNLFAYTGTASVYAAGGGATSTTTLDLSNTYLDWARRNMAANGFTGSEHTFIRASFDEWLDQQSRANATYDLVFCDPPTFSNSKAMQGRSFDVQRDHASLLTKIERILAPGGTIIFSCNLRSFTLDTASLNEVGIAAEDITAQTIPHDFARTPKVHHCFILQRC